MKTRQSGFSVVEIVMAVVIVGLIGAVGWLFWDKIASKPADNASVANNQATKKSTAPTADLETFSAKSIGVAFDYPSHWTPLDADGYPFKSGAPLDIHKTFTSPDGFKLTFSTMSATGLGGTGPCPQVTGFKNYGESKLDDKYVISMDDGKGGILLRLDSNKTEEDQSANCMYQNIINMSEPEYNTEIDDTYTVKPYAFTFGTFAGYDDYGNTKSTAKPSDKDLKDAVEILKSVRKL